MTQNLANAEEQLERYKRQIDELQALRILNRRLIVALAIAYRATSYCESELFISNEARTLIAQFQNQYSIIQNTIAQSKEINHEHS